MVKLSKKEKRTINALVLCGIRLSNVGYNLKQRTDLLDSDRASCKEAQENWDAALSKIPKWMRDL